MSGNTKVKWESVEFNLNYTLVKKKQLETTSKKLFNYMYNSEEKVNPHWSEDGKETNGNSGKVSKLCLLKNKNSEIE